jgi:aryl-alcohol dehydrogenase-like predicted oxidoreductase
LRVSEIVFGGGRVGGLLLFQDDDTKRAAIRRALAGGVNWIDTAPAYGSGKSESALGWLLAEVEETPYLSTKVHLDTDRLDDIPGQIEASIIASLTRLRRASVDLLQLHNAIAPEIGERAVTVDHVLRDGGVADGLERMRAQGLTRFTGITALGDAGCCRQVIESGRFDSAQVYYNLINPSAGRAVAAGWSGQDFGGVIAACRGNDVAVMDIRVLAAGVLATDRRSGRESPIAAGSSIEAEERRAKAVFAAIGHDHGSRAQTAIRFALANPDIACVIVGLAALSHLEEALGAAEMGPLPDPAPARLDRFHGTDFAGL